MYTQRFCRERAENEAAHKPSADEATANKAAADNAEADKEVADKVAAADDKAEADKAEVGRARCSPKRAHVRDCAAHGLDLPAGARAGNPTRGTRGPDDFAPTPGCRDQPEKGTRTSWPPGERLVSQHRREQAGPGT